MTNQIEQEFYECFDIKPMWEAREEVDESRDGYPIFGSTKFFATYKEADRFGYVPDGIDQELSYPSLTPSMLLELICVCNYKAFIESSFTSETVEGLKDEILKKIIKKFMQTNKHKEYIYTRVRKIMGVEE